MKRAIIIAAAAILLASTIWSGAQMFAQLFGTSVKWTPAGAAGLVWWVDASSIQGVANGGLMSAWPDLSPSGKHAAASGSARPMYKANALNGLPVVCTTNAASVWMSFTAVTNIRTAYVVASWDSDLMNNPSPVFGHSHTVDFHGASSADLFYPGAVSTYVRDGAVFENGTASTIAAVKKPIGAFKIFSLVTTGNTAVNQLSRDRRFTERTWRGHYAEVMFFAVAHDTATRQKIEGYLAWKWGLQASLPAPHQHKNYAP